MIKKTYHWKELTEDGLVKEPAEFGPYQTESLNGYGGHDTEEEALKRLEYISKIHKYSLPCNFTLVIEYEVVTEEIKCQK